MQNPSTSARVEGVRSIAVLRAGGLGDFVFALPALEALRAAYPEAAVTLLVAPAHAELLAGRPGPWDEVVEVPPYPGVRDDGAPSEGQTEAFFAVMRERAFDLAVQMHGGGRHSNPFVLRLGAGMTAGCRTPDAAPLDRWIPHAYLHSETARWLEVVALVGARPLTLAPRLDVTSHDRAVAREVVGPPRPLEVTLHPGAGSARRRWPVGRFAVVGDALVEAGATVYVVGAEAERGLTAEVVAAMRHPAVDLGGRLSLPGLVGLLERAALHAGNDSGPAHLARAVAPRTLTLFWAPNLLNAGPVGPADRHRTLLAWRLHCSECGHRLVEDDCPHDATLLDEITVDAVASAALALLDAAGSTPRPEALATRAAR